MSALGLLLEVTMLVALRRHHFDRQFARQYGEEIRYGPYNSDTGGPAGRQYVA
jgi:hypothetical protein